MPKRFILRTGKADQVAETYLRLSWVHVILVPASALRYRSLAFRSSIRPFIHSCIHSSDHSSGHSRSPVHYSRTVRAALVNLWYKDFEGHVVHFTGAKPTSAEEILHLLFAMFWLIQEKNLRTLKSHLINNFHTKISRFCH